MADSQRAVRSDDRLAEVEDELYGAPPDEFVERRDEAARAAKRDGDVELAEAIRSLRKPTAAAWALDSFVRADPSAVEALLDVGARLRDAVARGDGDAIRELMRERARSTAATLGRVRDHADEQGRPLSTSVASQVEQTLRAAVSSEDAARRLQRGVLTGPLTDTGLDALRAPSRTTGSSHRVPAGRSADGSGTDEQRRRDAERRADEAADRLAGIEEELEATSGRRWELETERAGLRRRLEEIDGLLQALRTTETEAQTRLRRARSELRSARHAADRVRPTDG